MRDDIFIIDKQKPACPIWALKPDEVSAWQEAHTGRHKAWLISNKFSGQRGDVLLLPDEAGAIDGVLLGLGTQPDVFALADLPPLLPEKTYRLLCAHDEVTRHAAFAWGVGTYQFTHYKKAKVQDWPRLMIDSEAEKTALMTQLDAVFLTRDLINIPANDMTPSILQARSEALASACGAVCRVLCGDALIAQNYPLIHAVGRAAKDPPRMIELIWGDPSHPKVTLVGKGVCFDTGGLNLKPGGSMALMKKDMGGAATALGLAQAIMQEKLPVRLRVLIGAVENAIGADAFRPGDVLPSRKGLTVEIGNTDAEGRLVLADLLAEACDEHPDLLIDFATLTGAARVALGPELMPFYTHDDALAQNLMQAGTYVNDPLWRMPLWAGYDGWLASKIADVNHITPADGGMAGSITAALFLARFVSPQTRWVHFDIYGWNNKARCGHPIGGEAHALRAVLHILRESYG